MGNEALRPLLFVPDRFVGGDDPATTIRALTSRATAHEAQAKMNQMHAQSALHLLGAAIEAGGGELRISEAVFLEGPAPLGVTWEKDGDAMILRIRQESGCRHG
jgi:hypothetical protein